MEVLRPSQPFSPNIFFIGDLERLGGDCGISTITSSLKSSTNLTLVGDLDLPRKD